MYLNDYTWHSVSLQQKTVPRATYAMPSLRVLQHEKKKKEHETWLGVET